MNKFYLLATLGMIASCSKSNEEINNPANQSKLYTLKQTDLFPTTYNSNPTQCLCILQNYTNKESSYIPR